MAFEAQRTAINKSKAEYGAAYRRDISLVFASSALLLVIIYLFGSLPEALEWLGGPISRAAGALFSAESDVMLAEYRAFIGSDIFTAAVSLTGCAVSLLLPFLLIKRFAIRPARGYFPFAARMPKRAFAFFSLAAGVTVAVNYVCTALLSGLYPKAAPSAAAGPVTTAVTAFITVILAPVGEELLFRGAFCGVLSRYSQGMAIVVSALTFGAAHRNPPQVINACVLGAFVALAYMKTGSLAPCVLIHVVNNAFSVIMQYTAGYTKGARYYALLAAETVLFVTAASAAGAAIVLAIMRRRRELTLYDDERDPRPRLGAGFFGRAVLGNAFFWIFALIVAAGTWGLYL